MRTVNHNRGQSVRTGGFVISRVHYEPGGKDRRADSEWKLRLDRLRSKRICQSQG